MQVANGVFLFLWLIIVAPLVLLNLKKFRIKREGEASRLNWLRIIIVCVLFVAISAFALSLYNFTVGYQAQLALEKQLSQQLEQIRTGECNEGPLYDAVKSFGGPEGKLFAQYGEKIAPKYAIGELPGAADLDEQDSNTVYMALRLAPAEKSRYQLLLARLHLVENVWQLESLYAGDAELESYLISKKLLYEDHVSPWRALR